MTVDQYASIRPFISGVPSYVLARDQDRVGAYDAYDNMYWNSPATFNVLQRGSNSQVLYVPTAKMLIDTVNRFLAPDFDYALNPKMGVSGDQATMSAVLRTLFRREQFFQKFRMNKKTCLTRGDSMWHIVADPTKPVGQRIAIYDLNPGKVFAITDPNDPLKVTGYYIVEQVYEGGKAFVLRQQYQKMFDASGNPTGIQSSLGVFDAAAWDERPDPVTGKIVTAKLAGSGWHINPKMLDPRITALPIYHIKNSPISDLLWGSSQMRGIEGVLGSVNQNESDADLSLALDGIGMYATDSGAPQDDEGNDVNWILGPGRVVEVAQGANFQRVQGISSMAPYHDRINHLTNVLQTMTALPDVATGTAVTVPASGIALTLKFAPLISMVTEKTDEVLGEYDHMFYDLQHGWLPVYEQIDLPDLDITPIVGDPMPVDRDARIAELLKLLSSVPPVVSVQYVQQELTKYGYEFPDEMNGQILEESAARAALDADAFSARLDGVLADGKTLTDDRDNLGGFGDTGGNSSL